MQDVPQALDQQFKIIIIIIEITGSATFDVDKFWNHKQFTSAIQKKNREIIF